jgi:hypothetical protein
VRGKAGIFLKKIPTESIFKYPVLISRTPAGSSQLGVGGGGGDHQRSLIPARGGGDRFPTQIISQLVDPRPHIYVGVGGGLIWAAVDRPWQSDVSFFSNFQTAQGNNANKYLICM